MRAGLSRNSLGPEARKMSRSPAAGNEQTGVTGVQKSSGKKRSMR